MSFKTLTKQELEAHVIKLRADLVAAQRELLGRADIQMWECCECGLQHHDSDVVYNHLRRAHKYPIEDANIGTIRVFK